MARDAISFEQKAATMREKHSADSLVAVSPAMVCLERHYTPAEIAVKWNLSEDAVRKLFQDEPGVLVLGGQAAHRRRYTTLRIPESVLQRVHRRMTKV